MNMNENENNFEPLRRLLKLKRHETPPPGFFDGFSGQVSARLRAGEGRAQQTAADTYFSEAPWLLKLLKAFELKPAFAGAFAGALGLLLVFGIVFADRPDSESQTLLQTDGQSFGSFAAVTPDSLSQTADPAGIIADTNPASSLQPVASFFDSQNPLVQPVSFSPSGN
jgi:hypothetical protein